MRIGQISAISSASISLNSKFGKKDGASAYQPSDASNEAVNAIKKALEEQQAVANNISEYSKLKRAFTKLSGADKKELAKIVATAATQIKKGSLDADSLVKSASKSLTKSLEAKGIDLETSLNSINSLYKDTNAKLFDSKGALR